VLFLLACLVHLCSPLAPILCSCTVRHQVCTVQEGQLLTVTETAAPVIGAFVCVCSSTLLRHHRCSCTAQHQVCVVQEGVQRLLFLQQPLLSSVFLHFCLLFFGVFLLFLVLVSCPLHLGSMPLAFLLAFRCVFLVLVLVSCPLHLCSTPGPFRHLVCCFFSPVLSTYARPLAVPDMIALSPFVLAVPLPTGHLPSFSHTDNHSRNHTEPNRPFRYQPGICLHPRTLTIIHATIPNRTVLSAQCAPHLPPTIPNCPFRPTCREMPHA